MPRRHELTDIKWNSIRDLLPGKDGDPGWFGTDIRKRGRQLNAKVCIKPNKTRKVKKRARKGVRGRFETEEGAKAKSVNDPLGTSNAANASVEC